jgi:hypothetical protein
MQIVLVGLCMERIKWKLLEEEEDFAVVTFYLEERKTQNLCGL